MTRRFGYILVTMALLLSLWACAAPPEPSEPDYPTLPTIPQELTPEQQLFAAITKTEGEASYIIRYGMTLSAGEELTEDAGSQEVSPENPLDRDAMYEKASFLPNRADFLEAFCALPLRAIPSNTGVLRYELRDLSPETAGELLYSRTTEWAEDGIVSICLEVDAAGRLSGFEIIIETSLEIKTLFLELTFPEES